MIDWDKGKALEFLLESLGECSVALSLFLKTNILFQSIIKIKQ